MTVRSTVRLCIVSNDNECIPICCSNLHCNSYNRAIQVINMKNDGGEADNLALPAKGLPNPKTLRWAHSTCSKDDLEKALLDEDINAIEADIVMGHHHKVEEEDNEKTTDENEAASSATTNSIRITEPIMAHPPNSISDLSFEGFIHRCMMKEEDSTTKDCSRQPRQHHYKHLKLDFKDVETIEPALNTLNKSMIIDNNDENNSNSNLTSTTTSFDKSIFLNADILKGPGCNTRNQQLAIIDAEIFMEKCLAFINSLINQEEDRKRIIMSLGWKVDCRSFYGYTDLQVKEMKDLIEKYDIMKRTGGKYTYTYVGRNSYAAAAAAVVTLLYRLFIFAVLHQNSELDFSKLIFFSIFTK
jgi:hypothetical protein